MFFGFEQRFQHILGIRKGKILQANFPEIFAEAVHLMAVKQAEVWPVGAQNNGGLPGL